ncbi:AraC family transcriptional regulator [Frigidibacter mobilis]|uniref:AraC family transcriptional regulator n=1 Tax=Frigidibacter mobilis TaxID=1335048 RepID=A0A159Z1N8_9RHOB|nr:AraC family transcriptional regulator [Frigidibacter mobilis]AMY68876.1 AraC family transcriptional regulator [Frigidibacter mobilis]
MELENLKRMSLRYLQASPAAGPPPLTGLAVFKRETVSDLEAALYEPVVCLILQGRKKTSMGTQFAEVGPGDALLVSHHVPVLSRITQASANAPYIAVTVTLDLSLMRSLYDLVADAPQLSDPARSFTPCRADPVWLATLGRYLDLLGRPIDRRVLGPAILRELHYRLLMSPVGGMLRSLLTVDSRASRIASAIQALRTDFRQLPAVPELARLAGMSETSFHHHFKAVTGTTPLQYQKALRLIAARTLLIEQGRSVSEAAFSVGYESPTHFSRDYRRKFGQPPSKQQPD